MISSVTHNLNFPVMPPSGVWEIKPEPEPEFANYLSPRRWCPRNRRPHTGLLPFASLDWRTFALPDLLWLASSKARLEGSFWNKEYPALYTSTYYSIFHLTEKPVCCMCTHVANGSAGVRYCLCTRCAHFIQAAVHAETYSFKQSTHFAV